ncbi:O-antigen ligase family protein [Legionella impletisoli]|uniref:O-antigen biosynthesis protein n=1 Tax=Legionella impletisoli TaxID=343510 RepID=A0A917N988_9GAMM|nr:O-antigen ligase family protein [Legionella impletisoli]GGI79038.1 O-antigen biosynthesis protein [Legionella impletisoli]
MLKTLKLTWQKDEAVWASMIFAAALMSIPLSSTARSIFLSVSVAWIAFHPTYYPELQQVFRKPWCISAILIFILAAFGCLWSPAAWHERFMVLEKYLKFLYLPILVVGFKDKRTRQFALYAFILAMTITCFISFLKAAHIGSFKEPDDPGFVFHNHIITGYMMVLAAFITALFAYRCQGKSRLGYGLLAGLFSYQILFINTGRTGYFIYIMLLALYLLQVLSLRKALLAGFIACSILFGAFSFNSEIQNRLYTIVSEWQSYQDNQNKDTSLGYRFQFHQFAKQLFYRHPVVGNGTGGFTHQFGEEKPVPSWDRRLLEPHSQYWFIATELGMLGLIAFMLFFGALFKATMRLDKMKAIALAVMLSFLVGGLSDSLLLYSGSGFILIAMMALCLGEEKSE